MVLQFAVQFLIAFGWHEGASQNMLTQPDKALTKGIDESECEAELLLLS